MQTTIEPTDRFGDLLSNVGCRVYLSPSPTHLSMLCIQFANQTRMQYHQPPTHLIANSGRAGEEILGQESLNY